MKPLHTHSLLALLTLTVFSPNVYALACPAQFPTIPIPSSTPFKSISPGYTIAQVTAQCGMPAQQKNYPMGEGDIINMLHQKAYVSYYDNGSYVRNGNFQSANFSVQKVLPVTELRYNTTVLIFVNNKWVGTRYLTAK